MKTTFSFVFKSCKKFVWTSVLLFLLSIVSFTSETGLAKSSGGNGNSGIFISGMDPLPAKYGGGVAIGLLSFFRVTYALGFADNSEKQPKNALANHPANAALWASFTCFWAGGCTDKEYREEVDHHMQGADGTDEYRKIVVNSFSAELSIPGWVLTPMISAGQAVYTQTNKLYSELDDSKATALYKAGLELHAGAFYLAGGVAYNADLPKSMQYSAFGRLGGFF